MLQRLVWGTASALNWLSGRGPKKPKQRLPLDDTSPFYYPPTSVEVRELAPFVAQLNDENDESDLQLVLHPSWQIVGWRNGSIYLRKEPHHPAGMGDDSIPLASRLGRDAERLRLANPSPEVHPDPLRSHPPVVLIASPAATVTYTQPRPTPQVNSPTSSPPPPYDPPTSTTPPQPSLPQPHPHSPLRRKPSTTLRPRPNLIPRPLFPNPTPPPQTLTRAPPRLCEDPLTPETLQLLLDVFDAALSHTRYAVTGHAALMVWGYRPELNGGMPMPAHVSIACPAEDREVILTWARVRGWVVYDEPVPASGSSSGRAGEARGQKRGGKVIGVPLPTCPGGRLSGGEVFYYEFKIRAVEDAGVWAGLEAVRPLSLPPPYVGSMREMMRTTARVLAVPALLNEFCRAWYFRVVKGDGDGNSEGARHVAGLILWALRHLASDAKRHPGRGQWTLTPDNVPCLVYHKFLAAFVKKYADNFVQLLEECGLCYLVVEAGNEVVPPRLEGIAHLERYSPHSYKLRQARGERSARPMMVRDESDQPSLEQLYLELQRELYN